MEYSFRLIAIFIKIPVVEKKYSVRKLDKDILGKMIPVYPNILDRIMMAGLTVGMDSIAMTKSQRIKSWLRT